MHLTGPGALGLLRLEQVGDEAGGLLWEAGSGRHEGKHERAGGGVPAGAGAAHRWAGRSGANKGAGGRPRPNHLVTCASAASLCSSGTSTYTLWKLEAARSTL